jgi:transcriptional regulator GlxA family with amidase domain
MLFPERPTGCATTVPFVQTIGIYLFPDVEELDAVGPWEVLAAWTAYWPDDGWQVVTFSRDGADVRCAKGLTVRPQHDWTSVPPIDVLIYPGGRGTRPQLADEDQLDWVRKQRAAGTLLTSVCTGSLVYAAAGVLRDRPATTYWGALDLLRELDPTIDVQPEARWVDSGEVITASGVSAGIDMALHLVRRFVHAERASQVRRVIQYDPAPPV